jgi:hypothetical protein
MTTLLLFKIAFVLFVFCMDVVILAWYTKLGVLGALELIFYVGAGCLITVGFSAAMLYFIRDVICR